MSKGKPLAGLLRNVGLQDVELVEDWWNGLTNEKRQKLRQSYVNRASWDEFAPEEVAGFFVDPEEFADTCDEPDDFYEYWVAHQELFETRYFSFHVCRAHPVAREVLKQGVLKNDFTCPFSRGTVQCPMLAILSKAPGKNWIIAQLLRS